MLAYCYHNSPLGVLQLVADQQALLAIHWPSQARRQKDAQLCVGHPILQAACSQLDAYFAGSLTEFTVAVRPEGSPFQQRVWQGLMTIPFGKAISYQQLATALGQPTAARAVGAANGKNPLAIIIPCHRVIASNGRLTGFAGGLAAKELLLRHENIAFTVDLPCNSDSK